MQENFRQRFLSYFGGLSERAAKQPFNSSFPWESEKWLLQTKTSCFKITSGTLFPLSAEYYLPISTTVCGWSEKKFYHNVHTLVVNITAEQTGQKHVLDKRCLSTDLHHVK